MTTASYTVLGIPMQQRSARRKLVVVVYALLAAACVASAVFARTAPLLYSWTLYATLAIAYFIFGGTGRSGLIKPFPNKPPYPEPLMVDVIRLQLAPISVGTPDDSTWRNDERELSRRDRAHYQAFQAIGILLIAILSAAAFGLKATQGAHHPEWLTAAFALNVIYAAALVGCILVLTLPAAIILWNEPDMSPDNDAE